MLGIKFAIYSMLQRVLIRKKKGANVLAEVYESRVINQERPTKLLLEIANSMHFIHTFIKMTKKSNDFRIRFHFCARIYSQIIHFSGGNIRLWSEKLKSQPIITFLEENPLPIQYISFASFENSETQFFYNCSHVDTSKKSVMG